MGSITIRNLDNEVKNKLRKRAADNGRSMEAEARLILRDAVEVETNENNLYESIRARVAPFGGVELEIPSRTEPPREVPTFD